MTAGGTDALEQALAVYRAPSRLPQLRNRPLPDSVLRLLRIAAGDAEALAGAEQTTGESASTLTDASVLYIQQVLFADDADSYRLLGVRTDASEDQVKEHYRWLMRWLHPDRHPERWEVVYSDRVNRAWQTLRSSERRSAYDVWLENARSDSHTHATQAQQLRRNALAVTGQPLLSTQLARRLPHIVLGGLGFGALLVLGLLYYLREEAPIPESTQQVTSDTQVASTDGLMPLPADSSTRIPARATSDVAVQILPVMPSAPPPAVPLPPLPSLPLPATGAVDVHAIKPRIAGMAKPAVVQSPINTAVVAAKGANGRRGRQNPGLAVTTPESGAADAADAPSDAAAAQPAKPVAGKPAAESPRAAAKALSQSFARAYGAGDLGTLMELFSIDAVGNRGGVETIAQDYDKLFRGTRSRGLELEHLAWTTGEDRMIGSGPFDATLRRSGASSEQHVEGWITIEARLIDGHWRIQRLIHKAMH